MATLYNKQECKEMANLQKTLRLACITLRLTCLRFVLSNHNGYACFSDSVSFHSFSRFGCFRGFVSVVSVAWLIPARLPGLTENLVSPVNTEVESVVFFNTNQGNDVTIVGVNRN